MTNAKKALGSTPTTLRQLLGLREITLALVRFIATTGVDGRPRERELEEEIEVQDERQDMESERLGGDDKEESREED